MATGLSTFLGENFPVSGVVYLIFTGAREETVASEQRKTFLELKYGSAWFGPGKGFRGLAARVALTERLQRAAENSLGDYDSMLWALGRLRFDL